MAKETFVEFADVYEASLPHLRGIMRNARKVFVWSISREAMATSIIYQLGAKSDFSELENKFIGREERVLNNLKVESKHSIWHVKKGELVERCEGSHN